MCENQHAILLRPDSGVMHQLPGQVSDQRLVRSDEQVQAEVHGAIYAATISRTARSTSSNLKSNPCSCALAGRTRCPSSTTTAPSPRSVCITPRCFQPKIMLQEHNCTHAMLIRAGWAKISWTNTRIAIDQSTDEDDDLMCLALVAALLSQAMG